MTRLRYGDSESAAEPPGPEHVIILCGGLGTRLASKVADRPKAMAPLLGRPFLEWLLLGWAAQSIRRAVLAVGHLGELIESHVGNGSRLGIEVGYSTENHPLGTAGALRRAFDQIDDERTLVANGDSYTRVDVARLWRSHLSNRARATIWAVPAQQRDSFGTLAVAPNGVVESFAEKAKGQGDGLVNGGVYAIERTALGSQSQASPRSLERDVFPALEGRGLYAVIGQGPLVDIGTPASYRQAEAQLAGEFGALRVP
jgi:NDP-sugar pyrophosphorylase family protein